MTFPCKENLIILEQMAKHQKQIYPDACDFGYVLNIATKNVVRHNLKELVDFYGAKMTGIKGDITTKVEVFIPIEVDDMLSGVLLTVMYCSDRSRRFEFVNIEEKRTFFSREDARDLYNCKVT